MFYVYVLVNDEGIFYKGLTSNIKKRLGQHNNNESKGTRGKGPWKLLYYEKFKTRVEARDREKYFKSGIGREYLKTKL